jgi:uncharacterized protein YkwD
MKSALNLIGWMRYGLVVCVGVFLVSCAADRLPTAVEITSAKAHGTEGDMETQVFNGVNRYRASQSKGVLKRHPGLDQLARHHSQRMLGDVKLSHRGYNNRVQLAEYHLKVEDLRENVFYARGFEEGNLPGMTVQGWIDSPGHRINLDANTKYCGVGVAKGEDGRYYATQLSASPLDISSTYHEGMPRSYSNIYGIGAGPDW